MVETRKLTTIRIDTELLRTAHDLGLNVSRVCENALLEISTHLLNPHFQENPKDYRNLFARIMLARGVGFEPTRPLLTTDLAGLPPTRLGQPRPVLPQPRRFLRGFISAFARFSYPSSRIVVSLVYLRFRKNRMSPFSQMYSNPTEISFLISSLSSVTVTPYSSSLLSPNMACSTCM